MKTLKDLQNLDLDKVASAIEADAGRAIPGLHESLKQAKDGAFAQTHTPDQIIARRRGRPVGSKQAITKEAVKIRLDADIVAALRSSGDGWQTRINDTLRASLALTGKVSPKH